MGNQCCNQRGIQSDNNAENLILETISRYQNKLKNQEEISQLIIDHFRTSLYDIEANPYQWITEDIYADFLQAIEKHSPDTESACLPHSISYNTSQLKKCIYLNYGDVNISSQYYRGLFHIILAIWLIGMMTYNKKKKIDYIKKIILKVSRVNTYANFGLFLKTYLEIFLIELTQNYSTCDEMMKDNRIEYNQLITSIFNLENLEDFYQFLMGRFNKVICIKKRNLRFEKIDNEFLTDDIILQFFEENDFLFNVLELRITFYGKYSNDMMKSHRNTFY